MLPPEFKRRSVKQAPNASSNAGAWADAIQRSDVAEVQRLLADCPDVNGIHFVAKLTPLHLACRCYALAATGPHARRARADQIVAMLLEAGADVEVRDAAEQMPASWGNPPALRARMAALAEAGHFPVAEVAHFHRLGSRANYKQNRTRGGYDNTVSVPYMLNTLAFATRSF